MADRKKKKKKNGGNTKMISGPKENEERKNDMQ